MFPDLPILRLSQIIGITVVVSWVKLRVKEDISHAGNDDEKLKVASIKAFTNICYLIITLLCSLLATYL